MATSNLAELLIRERVAGLSYLAIENKHNVDAAHAREIVREALSHTSVDDEWEQRGIMLLRLEKVVTHLWEGVENGSFEHGKVLLKSLEQISTLLALNKEIVREQKAIISDEQAKIIYAVIVESNKAVLKYIYNELNPSNEQLEKLVEWDSVTAEATTNALEAVIYTDIVDDDK